MVFEEFVKGGRQKGKSYRQKVEGVLRQSILFMGLYATQQDMIGMA